MSLESILASKEKGNSPHAFLSPSKYTWVYKEADDLVKNYVNSWGPIIGTRLHEIAANLIKDKIKLSKNDKKIVYFELLHSQYMIPRSVVDGIDLELIFENLRTYVNDAIGFGMTPEETLYYSDNCFGTSDAISTIDNILRIHDLKTGETKAHMEQLQIYAALYCLMHRRKPSSFKSIELAIYQHNDILHITAQPDEIKEIMDKIVEADKELNNFIQRGK